MRHGSAASSVTMAARAFARCSPKAHRPPPLHPHARLPEEPAVNERVDLGAVKFDGKTAIAGPTTRPTTTHSLCSSLPCDFGFDGHTVRRLPNHANVLSDDYCSVIVPDCIGPRTRYDDETTSRTRIRRSILGYEEIFVYGLVTPCCPLRRLHRAAEIGWISVVHRCSRRRQGCA
jgi:hypothetical protein